VYDSPANVFVASFVGSPSMNIAEGVIIADGGGGVVELGSRRLAVSPSVLDAKPELRDYFGRALLVGIRPEHLRYGGSGDVASEQRIGGEVLQVEFLGVDRHVHFSSGDVGTTFVARLPADSDVEVGSHVAFGVDAERLHFFEPAGGAAIGR
jgi:ABC-type sugar transport system ATPase subunit